jgi:hypothetical protein
MKLFKSVFRTAGDALVATYRRHRYGDEISPFLLALESYTQHRTNMPGFLALHEDICTLTVECGEWLKTHAKVKKAQKEKTYLEGGHLLELSRLYAAFVDEFNLWTHALTETAAVLDNACPYKSLIPMTAVNARLQKHEDAMLGSARNLMQHIIGALPPEHPIAEHAREITLVIDKDIPDPIEPDIKIKAPANAL